MTTELYPHHHEPSLNDQVHLNLATYLERLERYKEAHEELEAITNPESLTITDQTLYHQLKATMPKPQAIE